MMIFIFFHLAFLLARDRRDSALISVFSASVLIDSQYSLIIKMRYMTYDVKLIPLFYCTEHTKDLFQFSPELYVQYSVQHVFPYLNARNPLYRKYSTY